MLNKHIKIALILLVVSFPVLIYGIYQNNLSLHSQSRGHYFFSQTRDNVSTDRIVFKFPDSKTISLKKHQGFWRIEEADDYFVAFEKVNLFVKLIRNSTIYRSDRITQNDNVKFKEALRITSFDDNNKIIEDVFVAKKSQNNKYSYAKRSNGDFIYQINGNFELSSHPLDWAQMPLLAIPFDRVKSVAFDDVKITRNYPNDRFVSHQNGQEVLYLKNLFDTLWYLGAEDVRHSVHFNSSGYKKVKQIEIIGFSGIMYLLDLYQNKNEYWLTIRLDKDILFNPDIVKKLEDNRALYDGWYFKLNQDIGKLIAEFSI